jgi:hypothetical protein
LSLAGLNKKNLYWSQLDNNECIFVNKADNLSMLHTAREPVNVKLNFIAVYGIHMLHTYIKTTTNARHREKFQNVWN